MYLSIFQLQHETKYSIKVIYSYRIQIQECKIENIIDLHRINCAIHESK